MSNNGSVPGFAGGFIIGVAIGLVAALLLTPKSGKEIRELIRGKAADIPETIREHTADRKKVYRETWKTHKGQHKLDDSYFD